MQYFLCTYTLIAVFSLYEKGLNKMFAPPNPEKFLIQFVQLILRKRMSK